jgi:hypothetical protein
MKSKEKEGIGTSIQRPEKLKVASREKREKQFKSREYHREKPLWPLP